jgi:hypothetical protein
MTHHHSKSSKPFHGCFGRFAGDASELTDFYSPEWSLVRNKRDKESKKISKLSNVISWRSIPKEQVNFEVDPKENRQTYSRYELPRDNMQYKSSIKDKFGNGKG